jgi:hypothetical protein
MYVWGKKQTCLVFALGFGHRASKIIGILKWLRVFAIHKPSCWASCMLMRWHGAGLLDHLSVELVPKKTKPVSRGLIASRSWKPGTRAQWRLLVVDTAMWPGMLTFSDPIGQAAMFTPPPRPHPQFSLNLASPKLCPLILRTMLSSVYPCSKLLTLEDPGNPKFVRSHSSVRVAWEPGKLELVL